MKISGLRLYPVKSLRGLDVPEWPLEKRGLRHDRRWMVVDEDRVFRSLRSNSKMAWIATSFEGDKLVLSADGMGRVEVSIDYAGEPTTATVWSTDCKANFVSAEADRWLSEVLGEPSRLVAMPDDAKRPCNGLYSQPGDLVGFADACPVLVAGEASLADLNHRLDEPVPMNRFRANVIVSGSQPFEEDTWTSLQLGDLTLHPLKKCGRCLVVTTDEHTGERAVEPLKTLATYRKSGTAVQFGMYYAPDETGQLKVGDPVVGLP